MVSTTVVPTRRSPRSGCPAVGAGLGVEPGGGFVEEQQLRVGGQGDREVEPAALPTGQRRDADVTAVGEVDPVELGVDGPVGQLPVAGDAVPQVQELAWGQLVGECEFLEDHADVCGQGAAVVVRVPAQHADPPPVGATTSLEHLHGRGLSRSVGAEHGQQLALPGPKVDTADGFEVAVAAAQSLDLDGEIGPAAWRVRGIGRAVGVVAARCRGMGGSWCVHGATVAARSTRG